MGHPKTQIGAFVATLLEDLTKRQPKMRPVIVTEVERLIYRYRAVRMTCFRFG